MLTILICIGTPNISSAQHTWRGLAIAPEDRCSPYSRSQYSLPPALKDSVIARWGGVYSPYTGKWFRSSREVDVDLIVARSEAHDSGLCAADAAARQAFASDLTNAVLTPRFVGVFGKRDEDAGEWMPGKNRCWYADRVVTIRRTYSLSIDRAEADALEAVLVGCDSVELEGYRLTPDMIALAEPAPPEDSLGIEAEEAPGGYWLELGETQLFFFLVFNVPMIRVAAGYRNYGLVYHGALRGDLHNFAARYRLGWQRTRGRAFQANPFVALDYYCGGCRDADAGRGLASSAGVTIEWRLGAVGVLGELGRYWLWQGCGNDDSSGFGCGFMLFQVGASVRIE